MARSVALVAHDAKKDLMVDWARANRAAFERFALFATGTTGARLNAEAGLHVTRLLSGPLGGDAQLGAMIAENRLDALFFFIDPLTAVPHDTDVKSLLRLATHYDTPIAMNRASADAILAALVSKMEFAT
jgi:methylglyoxal synthase